MKRKLNTIQRKFPLLINKSYSYNSHHSLPSNNRNPPPFNSEQKEANLTKFQTKITKHRSLKHSLDPTKYEVIQRGHSKCTQQKFGLRKQIPPNLLKSTQQQIQILPDGSKNDDGTESAFCCLMKRTEFSSTWMQASFPSMKINVSPSGTPSH
ncbi:hypothetical protein AVEN_184749-1 [Araneus ventricosus]|uniref:Uncharacterized protein n=1 Tax=Araneus ventricosus TaxID=182803 RepID=A0A4Y2J0D4_ARAVE|nr:hypothetical protein AVEN_184749-1 [Araneus ventricosus]